MAERQACGHAAAAACGDGCSCGGGQEHRGPLGACVEGVDGVRMWLPGGSPRGALAERR